jgi:hypothetical protein
MMKIKKHYNYQLPVQTGVNQWSVFVRKYADSFLEDCVGVTEHRFGNLQSAREFSWNNGVTTEVGDYIREVQN